MVRSVRLFSTLFADLNSIRLKRSQRRLCSLPRGWYGFRMPTRSPILRISEKNEEFRPPPQVGIDTNLQFDIFQKKGTPTPTASIDTNGHCG